MPSAVAEGDGCPQCGMGKRDADEVWRAAKPTILCLLVHPAKPGLIKIGLTYSKLERCYEENAWDGWEIHRYRRVEEAVLAEALIWELLGCPPPNDGEPVSIDLPKAEQAFRELVSRMHQELALQEKERREHPPSAVS